MEQRNSLISYNSSSALSFWGIGCFNTALKFGVSFQFVMFQLLYLILGYLHAGFDVIACFPAIVAGRQSL